MINVYIKIWSRLKLSIDFQLNVPSYLLELSCHLSSPKLKNVSKLINFGNNEWQKANEKNLRGEQYYL